MTLGSPRVGNETFVAGVKAEHSVRLVNCCDAVTEVPPPIAGTYTHLKTCTYLTRDGQVLENPTEIVIEDDRHHARVEYAKKYAWKLHTVLVRDLADHAPINYARAFFS